MNKNENEKIKICHHCDGKGTIYLHAGKSTYKGVPYTFTSEQNTCKICNGSGELLYRIQEASEVTENILENQLKIELEREKTKRFKTGSMLTIMISAILIAGFVTLVKI